MENLTEYLSKLELADDNLTFATTQRNFRDQKIFLKRTESIGHFSMDKYIDDVSDDLTIEEGCPAVYINDTMLQSFTPETSEQNRMDVLNTFLLAQRAATKIYPKKEDIYLWYEKYIEVLHYLGWVFTNKQYREYSYTGNEFEIKTAILSILGNVGGGIISNNYVKIIENLLEGIKKLGAKDERLQIFNKRVVENNIGNFQISIANDDLNSGLQINLASFFVKAKDNINQILFIKSNKMGVEMEYNQTTATRVKIFSDKEREQIQEKLGDTLSYIASLDI